MERKNSGHELSPVKLINTNLAFLSTIGITQTQQKKIIMNRRKQELKEFVYLYNRSYSERVSEGELARIHAYPKP